MATITLVDFKTYRIPDGLNVFLAAFGLIFAYTQRALLFEHALFGMLLGFLITYGVRQSYLWYRGHHGLGLGDVKMVSASGLWIGISGIPNMLLIASVSGILYVLISSMLKNIPISKNEKIAFGPFLAFGVVCTWIMQNIKIYG